MGTLERYRWTGAGQSNFMVARVDAHKMKADDLHKEVDCITDFTYTGWELM